VRESPTQAKGRLEWATGAQYESGVARVVVVRAKSRSPSTSLRAGSPLRREDAAPVGMTAFVAAGESVVVRTKSRSLGCASG
jgi:hypothetical protein